MKCAFCQIAKGKLSANIIYKNEMVTCFLDYEPINEGHVLIVPNNHYLDVDELPDNVLLEINELSKKIVSALKRKYDLDGYSIIQNGGLFNDVGHYHMHVFPRYRNDGFGWKYGEKEYNASKAIADDIKKLIDSIEISSGLGSAVRLEDG